MLLKQEQGVKWQGNKGKRDMLLIGFLLCLLIVCLHAPVQTVIL